VLLWDKVKDQLKRKATELSLEEQQKLCIARLLPVKPKMLLMDEPCSALDPKGTEAVEELLWELRGQYTILIVTHNMAQARHASEECVFMLMGKVVEHARTDEMFVTPAHKVHRTRKPKVSIRDFSTCTDKILNKQTYKNQQPASGWPVL
jgi:phosphate transport system ATP-binding protein